ncbi:type VI immunity family protein [uncultured Aquincola sp.]|uniref:type VI immunity family protein n=1 Tax=uncultured Aquincola sp. TaxID=886556 RepID=UPI0032B2FDC2|tara:strand:+ start:300 stop:1616 length:1317 start_codon:yes stop_codon:yes gene_type:complete
MTPSNTFDYPTQPGRVLTPHEARTRYFDELRLQAEDGRNLVVPTLFATVVYERGADADVRQALVQCFDGFEQRFGKHLRGGHSTRTKFTAKTSKGVASTRKMILEAPPFERIEFVRADVTDPYTAPEYALKTLTNSRHPTIGDGGMLSYLKFLLPWHLADSEVGLAQYHEYLRFVCRTLPVRGGYGGLTSSLPFDYDRYMPMEYALAKRFTGLEIDAMAYYEKNTYRILSQEGDRRTGPVFGYLKPGANVILAGHIKGVNWITLLGDVFVERLGGEAALRHAFVDQPEIAVERQGQCLLVQAGPLPRLGAPEEGLLAPYAAVNRVVRALRNPDHTGLHTYMEDIEHADEENSRAWLARFDLPQDGPVTPWTPGAPPVLAPPAPERAIPLSARPGQPCPKEGTWFAPHLRMKEVHMKLGEPMPAEAVGPTGGVVWYFRG